MVFIVIVELVYSPSHQLGTEERGDSAQWIGGTSSGENELNGSLVWQPDAGRVVETVVAGSTDRIVKAILESLQVLSSHCRLL